MDAYLFESGHRSLTRQVLGRGLAVVVVDREGMAYEPADWPSGRTLWQGDQEGLLIADNQTRSYANGGLDRRRGALHVGLGAARGSSPAGGGDR